MGFRPDLLQNKGIHLTFDYAVAAAVAFLQIDERNTVHLDGMKLTAVLTDAAARAEFRIQFNAEAGRRIGRRVSRLIDHKQTRAAAGTAVAHEHVFFPIIAYQMDETSILRFAKPLQGLLIGQTFTETPVEDGFGKLADLHAHGRGWGRAILAFSHFSGLSPAGTGDSRNQIRILGGGFRAFSNETSAGISS